MRVELTDAARSDLRGLDPSIQKRVLKRLKKLREAPELGKALGDGLSGYRSLVVGDRDWRIVYRITADAVVVWAIGKRDNNEVYEEATRRVHAMPRSLKRPMRDILDEIDDLEGRPPRRKHRRLRRRSRN